MTLKRKITFDLNKRGDKIEHLPIRMRITYAGDRFDAPMGYNIDLDKWDAATQRVRSGCSNKLKQTATEINLHLSERERGADRIFTRFELDGIIPTFEEVKAAYYAQYGSKQNEPTQKVEVTLLERFDEFIKEGGRAKDWSEATLKKFATVRKHLLGFMPEPRFDDLNENGLLDYLSYLRDKKGMRNGTIDKYLGFMRWFLGWALAKGYHTNTAFQTFKPKLKRADIQPVFLTWEELMKVYYFELPLSKQYLERVRDVFCFCCFTSLRYSDVKNLKRSDIRADRLYVTTVKTADSLVIELNKYSRPILAKYADDLFKGNLALPVISNQKINSITI